VVGEHKKVSSCFLFVLWGLELRNISLLIDIVYYGRGTRRRSGVLSPRWKKGKETIENRNREIKKLYFFPSRFLYSFIPLFLYM
jgi:hypothetical protein